MRKPFPRRVFLNTDLKIADFMEQAGSVMFENWRALSTPVSPTRNHEPETERLVKSAIIDALSNGRLLAIVFLALINPVQKTRLEAGETKSSLDEELLEELAISPKKEEIVAIETPTMTYGPTGPFYISENYWSTFGDDMIDWPLSTGCFPVRHILVANGDPLFVARPDILEETYYKELQLIISDSAQSISAMFEVPSMPSEFDFSRYKRFQNRLNDEIVAVVWKFLALSSFPKGSKPHKEIGAAIDVYTRKHKLPDVEYHSKANMITAIIKQWDRANLLEFPLLTTGGDAPPKALRRKK